MIPALIGALLADVDLFPGVLAHVGDLEVAERARSCRLRAARRKDYQRERDSCAWDTLGKSSPCTSILRILAAQAIDVLPAVWRITCAVAEGDVEIPAFGPKPRQPPLWLLDSDWSIERIGKAVATSATFGVRRRRLVVADFRVVGDRIAPMNLSRP
jgi:hypothetical protein